MNKTLILTLRVTPAERRAIDRIVAKQNGDLSKQGKEPNRTTSTLMRQLLHEKARKMGVAVREPPPEGISEASFTKTYPAGSVVFFAQLAAPSGVIRIGSTTNLAASLAELSREHPVEVRLLLAIPGDAHLQRAIELMFAHVQSRGGWFLPDPALLSFITERGRTQSRPKTSPKGKVSEFDASAVAAKLRGIRDIPPAPVVEVQERPRSGAHGGSTSHRKRKST